MKALGDKETTSLIVAKFPKPLHVKLRMASVKYGKSIKNIVIEALELWLDAPEEEE